MTSCLESASARHQKSSLLAVLVARKLVDVTVLRGQACVGKGRGGEGWPFQIIHYFLPSHSLLLFVPNKQIPLPHPVSHPCSRVAPASAECCACPSLANGAHYANHPPASASTHSGSSYPCGPIRRLQRLPARYAPCS
jgi:hypothetical protein